MACACPLRGSKHPPGTSTPEKPLSIASRPVLGSFARPWLRRTFISLLLAAGADVSYVMAQAGHNDPKMTLGLYAQVIASKTDHGAALDGIVGIDSRVVVATA